MFRIANRSFHCTSAAFEVMFEEPTITVWRIRFLLLAGEASCEWNRYIFVCRTPYPRHPKWQRLAKLRRPAPWW